MNIMSMRWGKLYRGTPAELALEDAVAALGVPYRTQFPGYLYGFRFFPDFLLPTIGLVIEVDDDSHNRSDKILADQERTEALEARGWTVVRCTNEKALEDPHGTLQSLLVEAGMWPLPTSARGVAESLPKPKKAPAKERRAAKSAAVKAKRARSTARRAAVSRPSPPAGRQRRRAPAVEPLPTPIQ